MRSASSGGIMFKGRQQPASSVVRAHVSWRGSGGAGYFGERVEEAGLARGEEMDAREIRSDTKSQPRLLPLLQRWHTLPPVRAPAPPPLATTAYGDTSRPSWPPVSASLARMASAAISACSSCHRIAVGSTKYEVGLIPKATCTTIVTPWATQATIAEAGVLATVNVYSLVEQDVIPVYG
jgi:hypothetical protein